MLTNVTGVFRQSSLLPVFISFISFISFIPLSSRNDSRRLQLYCSSLSIQQYDQPQACRLRVRQQCSNAFHAVCFAASDTLQLLIMQRETSGILTFAAFLTSLTLSVIGNPSTELSISCRGPRALSLKLLVSEATTDGLSVLAS